MYRSPCTACDLLLPQPLKWIADEVTVWAGLDTKLFLRIIGRTAMPYGVFCGQTRNWRHGRPSRCCPVATCTGHCAWCTVCCFRQSLKWISDKATVWTGLDIILIKLFFKIIGRAAATHGLFCRPTRDAEQVTQPSKMIKESLAKSRNSLCLHAVCVPSSPFAMAVPPRLRMLAEAADSRP